MTGSTQVAGGHIAWEAMGTSGPTVICAPSLGDLRAEYRLLLPTLARAGHRAVAVDLRGHGGSSTGFGSYAPEDVGADLVALARDLAPGPVHLVGTSFSAAAAVWAAAELGPRVASLVLIGPFVRDVPMNPLVGLLVRLLFAGPWGPAAWGRYYRSLYPSDPPPDLDEYVAALQANLREPGRFSALQAMIRASKARCEARLPEVRSPALVVMGEKDPDFRDPAAEAAWVAERLRGERLLVPRAGHYPHVERPAEVAEAIVAFLGRCGARAAGSR